MSDTCKACHAPILWALTESGKKMPVDPATKESRLVLYASDEAGTVLDHADADSMFPATAVVQPTYLSHFATCPSADRFRKG